MLHSIFYGLYKSVLGALLLFAAVITCWHPPVAFAGSVLKIGGVGSALPSMELVAKAFEKSHPGFQVQILPNLGSSGGVKALLAGAIDIGLSGRALKDDERRKGAIETEYAYTPFIFVGHDDIPASGLSTKELIDIYEGKRQMWSNGTRIRLVLRPESDVDTTIIKNISPEMEKAVNVAMSRIGKIVSVTNQDSDNEVVKMPGALGASTLAQVISEKRPLKIFSFNGVQPTTQALAKGTYPLAKHFYFVTTSKESALAKQFISFVHSRAGRKILSKKGMIPLDIAGRQEPPTGD